MAVHRVTAQWSGFPGAPGYSNFHFSGFTGGADANAMRTRVHDFFDEMSGVFPNDVSITVSPTVEVYDEETGMLTDYQDDDSDLVVTSSATSSNFSGPSGAVINWLTNTVSEGRRVRGRTFIVPIANSQYESDGTLDSLAITRLRSGANALLEGDFNSELVVWAGRSGSGPGVLAPVTGFRIPDMAAVLRSRRD